MGYCDIVTFFEAKRAYKRPQNTVLVDSDEACVNLLKRLKTIWNVSAIISSSEIECRFVKENDPE